MSIATFEHLTARQVQRKYEQAAKLIDDALALVLDVYEHFIEGDETEAEGERASVTNVFDKVQAAKIRTEDEANAWRTRADTSTR